MALYTQGNRKLIVVRHSMGEQVAKLLYVMHEEEGKLPAVRCYKWLANSRGWTKGRVTARMLRDATEADLKRVGLKEVVKPGR